jgi:hypothetical protein
MFSCRFFSIFFNNNRGFCSGFRWPGANQNRRLIIVIKVLIRKERRTKQLLNESKMCLRVSNRGLCFLSLLFASLRKNFIIHPEMFYK